MATELLHYAARLDDGDEIVGFGWEGSKESRQ